MGGRGEELEQVELAMGLPFRLGTEAVYRAWDDLGGPRSNRRLPVPAGPLGALLNEFVNDLEPAAESIEPRLRPFREKLEKTAHAPAVLAGSGSAYAVPLPLDVPDHAALAHRVSRTMRVPVVAASTVSKGVRLGSG
jgi:4-diphosphocytidyl-2C-methyl-D-erythritol kinase